MTGASPEAASVLAGPSWPYSSTAILVTPVPGSTWHSRASPWVNPLQTTIRSGLARTPRARAR